MFVWTWMFVELVNKNIKKNKKKGFVLNKTVLIREAS